MPDLFETPSSGEVKLSAELIRVHKMPRRQWSDEEAAELAREMTDALRTPYGTMELRPLQAVALCEIGMHGGLFGPLRCGSGKTLVSLLAPVVAFAERPLLLVPAKLVDKTERDRRALAEHWRLPSFLRIMTYEWLGRVQAADALEEFLPDMIIPDECFVYGTLVLTDEGWVPIGDVVEFGIGTFALSKSSSGCLEWKKIVRRLKKTAVRLVKVTHDYGSFVCTGNHKIWTGRGYVEALSLLRDDHLLVVRHHGLCSEKEPGSEVLLQGLRPCFQEREEQACEEASEEQLCTLRCAILRTSQSAQEVLFTSLSTFRSQVTEGRSNHLSGLRSCRLRSEEGEENANLLFAPVFDNSTYAEARREEKNLIAASETGYRKNVSSMRSDFFVSIFREAQYPQKVLQHSLCGSTTSPSSYRRAETDESRKDFSGAQRKTEAVCCNTHALEQSDSGSCGSGKNVACNAWSDFLGARRQRRTYQATAFVVSNDRFADGGCNQNGACSRPASESSPFVQSRFSRCSDEDGDRSRWQHPQDAQVEVSRCQEDAGTRSSRVVCVEVLERAGAEGAAEGLAADTSVYDLEIEDNHNYFADGVLASNCHKIFNLRAAVSRRVRRHMSEHPEVKFVPMSGTMTKRSLHDFAHLARWALGTDRLFLPRRHDELELWCDALDERKGQVRRADPGALRILCNEEEQELWRRDSRAAARSAFRRRMVDTPGVVASYETEVDATLTVSGVECAVAPAVDAAFERLRNDWELPDGRSVLPEGTQIKEGLGVYRHARELALGFFYFWDPEPPREWMDARSRWHKFVRQVLKNSRTLDSPHQVALAHPNAPELLEWRAIKPSFKPRTVAAWIDDSVLEFCAGWAEQNRGIIWTEHVEFGERLQRDYGLSYYGEEGYSAAGKFIDDHPPAESLVASINSNDEGRNLQAWSTSLITSAPANGKKWEQVLSRVHRDGQEADEVSFDVVVTCAEHAGAFWQAVSDCRYVEQAFGSPQKLLVAGINVPMADEIAQRSGARWRK